MRAGRARGLASRAAPITLMSGIAGIARARSGGVSEGALHRMAAALRHRGLDARGAHADGSVGLVQARLAAPHASDDGPTARDAAVVVALDGEIHNRLALREELARRGYALRGASDAELLGCAYAQWGEAMLPRLNGEFAFAIHDRRADLLLLARDRFGARPLEYTLQGDALLFASEARALFASGEVQAAPDLRGLDEVFTFRAARAPRTVFRDVLQLEPGCLALWRGGSLRIRRYYRPDYAELGAEPAGAVDTLDDLLRESVAMRMADASAGVFRTGRFGDGVVSALGERAIALDPGELVSIPSVGSAFPEVVRHAATPLVRATPAVVFLLARAAREQGAQAVLTGEGADELFLGADLYRETAIRLFCLRQPTSTVRPQLFERLYPPGVTNGERTAAFRRRILLAADGTADVHDPLFSHLPRFLLTARIKDYYSAEMRMALAGSDPLAELRAALPGEFMRWDPLNRAAYLELVTRTASQRLGSHGDRMAMAHGVALRHPFLDHQLFEFSAALPVRSKLRGLRDREILRRWAARALHAPITTAAPDRNRPVDAQAFFGAERPDYVDALLGDEALRRTGYFEPSVVAGLVRRCTAGRAVGIAENHALIAVLSTQLWHHTFFDGAGAPSLPAESRPTVRRSALS